MRKFFGCFCIFAFSILQSPKVVMHYTYCDIFKTDSGVVVGFDERTIRYLGVDYAKQIGLYDNKNRLRFSEPIEVVNYLSTHWGWDLLPYRDDTIYRMRHVIENGNITNIQKNIDAFKKGEMLYGR